MNGRHQAEERLAGCRPAAPFAAAVAPARSRRQRARSASRRSGPASAAGRGRRLRSETSIAVVYSRQVSAISYQLSASSSPQLSSVMIQQIRTIDAHTAGEPLRLIVDGFPTPQGRTMLERREWLREHHDHLRTALMLEPRGHADMYGALLTEPEHAGSDAGVLFMHNEGYSTMCGHGVIAVVTIALERRLAASGRGARATSCSIPRPVRFARARRSPRPSGRRRVSSVELRERAVVRPARRRAGERLGRARSAPTWPSAAPSMPSSTARPRASRPPDRLDDLRRAGMDDQARGRVSGRGGASGSAYAERDLRHHLHRPAFIGGRGPAQCHDFCGGRSRPIAVRHGNVRRDGRARGMGVARPEQTVRSREHHRHAGFVGRIVRETMLVAPAIGRAIEAEASKATRGLPASATFLVDKNGRRLRHGSASVIKLHGSATAKNSRPR